MNKLISPAVLPVMMTTKTKGISQSILKRALDIAAAALLLPLLSPVLLLAAAAVKLTSHGPIFFLQERVGQHHRKFTIIKFRSMVTDAEARMHHVAHHNEADGPIFKIRHDPRVTAVGKFLRRYSIDELPQLINVLRGEMSLVGPRPHLTAEVAKYGRKERRRLEVKPGMTGLAQVSGRSDLCWKDALALDLHYVDRWHFLFDAHILSRTIRTVVAATGAA